MELAEIMRTQAELAEVEGTETRSYSQQFLNNDVLETIIKIILLAFPFMRSSLRAVNSFFRATVKKMPCPEVYIPELCEKSVVISIRKLVMLKGKCSIVLFSAFGK